MCEEFLIVIDANIMKDCIESPLKSYEDDIHEEHVINAEKLFKNFKKNIKICLDNDMDSSKIMHEYKKNIGNKNESLYKQSMVQLSLQRLRFISKNNLTKLTSTEKKSILQKGFDRKDLIYIDVAKSINNKRFIISRDSAFYNPKNKKKIGDCTTVIAKHLKKKFDISVRIAKDALTENDIVVTPNL